MSRAKMAGSPKESANCELFFRTHCTHITTPFVYSARNAGLLTSIVSRTREYRSSNSIVGNSLVQTHAGIRCGNTHRDESHPSAYGGSNAQPSVPHTGIEHAEKELHCEMVKALMEGCDKPGERESTSAVHDIPADQQLCRRICRPEGRKRGLRLCR